MMCNNFKRENYSIPNFNCGGSTRPSANTLASTGDPVYVVCGASCVTVTVTGTRYLSTGLFQETILTTSTAGLVLTETAWTQVLGVQLCDKLGKTMTTQVVDCAVYGVSTNNSTAQVAYTSSGVNGSKLVAFQIPGNEVTYNVVSGNAYITTKVPTGGTTPVRPTSYNCFKNSTANNIIMMNERTRDWILFDSDTGGAVGQVKVWEG